MIAPSRRTFKDLVDIVLSYGGMSDDASRLRALAKDAVAKSHERRLVGKRWTFMLFPIPQRLSISAGTQSYSLHEAFLSPQYFRSLSASNPRTVRPVPYSRVAEFLPDAETDSGDTVYVTLHGVSKVQQQPSGAAVLSVASTDSDDNGKTVTIVGDTATGIQEETIAVGSSGSVAFTTVLDVRKNGSTAFEGTITITSGSVTVLSLGAAQYGRQFHQLRCLLPPRLDETWEYNFFRLPKQLVEDNDIPDTPYPFDRIHVLDALLGLQDIMRHDASQIRLWQIELQGLIDDMEANYQDGLAENSETPSLHFISRD